METIDFVFIYHMINFPQSLVLKPDCMFLSAPRRLERLLTPDSRTKRLWQTEPFDWSAWGRLTFYLSSSQSVAGGRGGRGGTAGLTFLSEEAAPQTDSSVPAASGPNSDLNTRHTEPIQQMFVDTTICICCFLEALQLLTKWTHPGFLNGAQLPVNLPSGLASCWRDHVFTDYHRQTAGRGWENPFFQHSAGKLELFDGFDWWTIWCVHSSLCEEWDLMCCSTSSGKVLTAAAFKMCSSGLMTVLPKWSQIFQNSVQMKVFTIYMSICPVRKRKSLEINVYGRAVVA